MSIPVRCGCGWSTTLGDDKAGRRLKCPRCDAVVRAGAAEPSTFVPTDPSRQRASWATKGRAEAAIIVAAVVTCLAALSWLAGLRRDAGIVQERDAYHYLWMQADGELKDLKRRIAVAAEQAAADRREAATAK